MNDSGGFYTVTQYITIFDSKTFYFAGYNPGEDTSNEVTAMFNSFQLQKPVSETPKLIEQQEKINQQYLFINCGIVIFGAVAIVSIIGIIKAKTNTNKESDENEN